MTTIPIKHEGKKIGFLKYKKEKTKKHWFDRRFNDKAITAFLNKNTPENLEFSVYLNMLYIENEYRGNGYAVQALKSFEQSLPKPCVIDLWASVDAGRGEMMSKMKLSDLATWYTKQGYTMMKYGRRLWGFKILK